MLFNSFEFLVFFPVVTAAYFLLPHRFRWGLLLLASCVFYMASVPAYIAILGVTIVIDYFAAIRIEDTGGRRRKAYLVGSIVSTCLVLFAFKYFNFFNDSAATLARLLHWNYPIAALEILLPIGLSFHTFQSLSYVIEVFRGNQKAERHFGIYSLYVMFYPQLVAGPIERPQNLLHQFREEHRFEYRRVTDGLKLMGWGLFKKVVVADRLAIFVNAAFHDPTQSNGLALAIASALFTFQIYCDFSGYSDIARGSAQVMGFRLMENFRRPFHSTSISEFWTRWHISLSTWFRDYVYIPLGGNRVAQWRWNLNLFVTFTASGLWHGASWNYVAWGALNGFYLVFANWTRGARERIAEATTLSRRPALLESLQVATTFVLIWYSFVIFRARSLSEAWYITRRIVADAGLILQPLGVQDALAALGGNKTEMVVALLALAILESVHLVQRRGPIRPALARAPGWSRWGLYYAFALVVVLFGVYSESKFIYFQF